MCVCFLVWAPLLMLHMWLDMIRYGASTGPFSIDADDDEEEEDEEDNDSIVDHMEGVTDGEESTDGSIEESGRYLVCYASLVLWKSTYGYLILLL
jgi:hypothetical protein